MNFKQPLSIKKYSRKIKLYFSSIHAINLKWLQHTTLFFLITFITVPFILIFMQNMKMNCLFGQTIFSIFYFFLFFQTLNQSAVFSDLNYELASTEDLKVVKTKYAKSQIKKEEVALFSQKIKQCIEQDKLFLVSNFNIKDLSDKTGISIHSLSQVINQEFNMNFFEFINSYRVKYAKTLLIRSDYSNQSIESIGYDSGFGTKASFYTCFKKHTSVTPANFRNNFFLQNKSLD
ncbi:MAG: hypothetical protein CVU05_05390 [Bacteroidetes bacterium HGW-Bacteroidetes-21]|nr:MAG: hypothetical protein CVU05_05390 [Bacteroidetes bacterium HGW-Bacteroidetes-21]